MEVYIPKQEGSPLAKDFGLRWVSLTASRAWGNLLRGLRVARVSNLYRWICKTENGGSSLLAFANLIIQRKQGAIWDHEGQKEIEMRQCVRKEITEESSRITGKGHPYPLRAPQPQLIARGHKGPVTFRSSARMGAQNPQVSGSEISCCCASHIIAKFLNKKVQQEHLSGYPSSLLHTGMAGEGLSC